MIAVQVKWPTRKLADCGEWLSGGTPSRANASFWNGDIPWISSKSLKSFDLSDSEDRITQAAVENGSALVPRGTVIFVVRGMSLANEFRVGVTTRPVAFNQDLRAIVPAKDIDGRFLTHFLKANQQSIIGLANNASHGTKRLPTELVEAVMVPVPPLPEQHRIVAILDKAAAIRRKREDGIHLTEELLRSTFLEMFGDPVMNERRWPRKPMSEILDNIDSGWSPKCHDRRAEDSEWAVLKLGAVTYCEYQPEENKALPESEQPQPDLEVKAGDLLMTRKNTYDLVAASAFVFETPPKLMLPDLIFRLRIKGKAPVRAEYLWGLLTHPGKRRSIQSLAGGTAGSMPNISKAKLLDHLVELPPKPLQDKFADFMHAHRRMKCKRRELVAEQSGMFDALVQRAFRGEL